MNSGFNEQNQDKKISELHRQEEEALISTLATTTYHLPVINLGPIIIDMEALRTVSLEDAKRLSIAPFKITGKHLHIALHAPHKEGVENFLHILETKGFIIHRYMASIYSLEKVWERYEELSFSSNTRSGGVDISGETLITLGEEIHTILDVAEKIDQIMRNGSTHSVSSLLEIILAGAIAIDASDIHIEVQEKEVRLRYRIDGVLQDVAFFENTKYKMINSRIKIISGLKLTQTENAQDGRFSIFIKNEEIGIRTSVIPGAYGEAIVMRLLNPKSIQVKFESLGIEPALFEILDREIKRPNGLILITGPTGSGKTTTLYSFLQRIYSKEIKVITIEDPIEYHLTGITQTQAEQEKGYTFAEGLRSALRQDPDVIMVGEIRDNETASIAINAALTGHMVFSTLHTNNASGVIPRLIDLGINPKILTSALTTSIAQRLVRKLCTHCAQKRDPDEKERTLIDSILQKAKESGKIIEVPVSWQLSDAVGCDVCNFTGYKGRIGVFEAILTDSAIEAVVTKNPSEREIRKIADSQGMLRMQEDGIAKVLKGVTSLDELQSAVDLHERE